MEAMLVKDFRPRATKEQLSVIDRLFVLARKEQKYYGIYQTAKKEIGDEYSHLQAICSNENEVRDFMDLAFDEFSNNAPWRIDSALDKLQTTQGEMRTLFKKARDELNMGHLGYIQRNYEGVMKTHVTRS